ncbi:hypothetical protein [Limnovirga soli]|uniref:Uncharacterized protein n=1 Tax=Limnovirga soli TaxID=2656915 RepID=A0A8J8JUJ1_9BACT|nr:hypothetical protein [Limnovirga soli]NNV55609.1 hypothetical protein [Limnovirga soli]
MTLTPSHIEFENFCNQLIGFTITKVEYSEIDYEPTRAIPYYPTQFQNLHSVDFSIFLHTDKNNLIEIYWDGQFFEYGIGVKLDEKSDFSGFITWDVSESELWKKFIGTTITDIKISWVRVNSNEQKSGKKESFIYPQDISLMFTNHKKVFISAAGFLEEGDSEVYGMLDNLSVTDNEYLARQVKMIT